jgi:hypothetical protein
MVASAITLVACMLRPHGSNGLGNWVVSHQFGEREGYLVGHNGAISPLASQRSRRKHFEVKSFRLAKANAFQLRIQPHAGTKGPSIDG